MKNKKAFAITLGFFLLVASIVLLLIFGPTFSVTYSIRDEGGYIIGNEIQTVSRFGDALEVEAVPLPGYRFICWLDNFSHEPTRKDKNVTKDIDAVAVFKKLEIRVSYEVEHFQEYAGGYIDGTPRQTIKYGEESTEVTAVAFAGYVFVGWSDGVESATRQDRYIKESLTVFAYFVKTTQLFTYEYNGATSSNSEISVTLTWNKLNEAVFVVPQKEGFTFQGWFLDPEFTKKVANNAGQLLASNEIFEYNSGKLFAKWNTNEIPTINILLVFVTEIEAALLAHNGNFMDVDTKMTKTEKLVCERIADEMFIHLNAMTNNLVVFEIDTYFTTVLVEEDSFSYSLGAPPGGTEMIKEYNIFADDIPEVVHMLGNYRSVLTSFNMHDYRYLLHLGAGVAGRKYGLVNLEVVFGWLTINDQPIELLLDMTYPKGWEPILEVYLHELTHTFERYSEVEEQLYANYHDFRAYYFNRFGSVETLEQEIIKLFLLNEAFVDGHRVGIPASFWQSKSKIFTYVYNGATGSNEKESLVITKDNLYDLRTLVVPEKEGFVFDGWYLDSEFTIRLTNGQGQLYELHNEMYFDFVESSEIFDVVTDCLYAKWSQSID